MNIKITDSWLREYLKTNAKPKEIERYLSLCGPSVEKLEKIGNDWVYDIEVTTNRVDMMSVYGIAREAYAILPQFGIKASLLPLNLKKVTAKKDLGITIVNDPKLCKRILAIKLEGIKLGPSPQWLQDRLIKVGQRPLNNAIDITNYIMWELGHPIHAFDYDRITTGKIIVREAIKGEKLLTLDNIEHTLKGGEVIFDNGKGEIIDLPGIMGTKNTVVSHNTNNVLLWIESVDPVKIRNASMGLGIRSQAAVLNEKNVDPELGLPTILKAVELYRKVTGAKAASKLFDLYETSYKTKSVKLKLSLIEEKLGVAVSKEKVEKILKSLDFKTSFKADSLTCEIPSFRAHDVSIPEDIIEEVARIYGYQNLPSLLMEGKLPEPLRNSPFEFEYTVKNILKNLNGSEIYSLSLVPKSWVSKKALRLKNPLGKDSEYLRDSLMPSILKAASQNTLHQESFHLFEIANIYIPQKNKLPLEKMMLGGVFFNYNFRDAKGIIESFLDQLNINGKFITSDIKDFLPSCGTKIISSKNNLGIFGKTEKDLIYYEFEIENLAKSYSQVKKFKQIPKYPPQIEDITFKFPERTKVGDAIKETLQVSRLVAKVELIDTYRDSYTFRIWYQDPKKTLSDKEVEKIRKMITSKISKIFNAIMKN